MSKESSNASSTGIGFFGLLTIVFITLKLLKKIDWSWLWVLCPLWGPIIVFIAIVFIVAIISYINDKRRARRIKKMKEKFCSGKKEE